MEIFRNVYQIASLVADRNLFQYLFVGDNTVLLDTGASYTPAETISPFLKKVGLEPSRLSAAIAEQFRGSRLPRRLRSSQ